MSNYDLGKDFEVVTHDFFLWLFKEIDIQVNNKWIQKSGYQFGFDVGFQVAISNENFFKREIYIECKNYEKSILEKSQLYDKLVQLKMSSFNKTNSIFIFLSPKVDLKKCTQDSNPVMLENFFNEAFELKTIILTPDNKIKEIFALNNEIYFRVYGEENLIEINSNDKSAILNYFKNLLISKGEIPNFSLTKELKGFLGEASINISNDIYIERKLKTNKFSFLQEDKNLKELLKENDYILLLGEPGSGKTTELKNIAKYFKENIEILGISPIFISLSNIKKFDNIEEILPAKWDSNNQILLLFDSLDEFEFRSKLSEQIESLLKLKDISFKIIITCRTYAYNEELSSFKPVKFYLDGFKDKQIIEILNKKYNLPIEEFDNINKYKFKDILEDPFMLNRFGLYFKKNKNTPDEINEIYDDIISELKYDDVEVYKIFALILELTKSISIEKDELRSLFGLKYKKLIKLEFIQKSFDKLSFKFTHKNYQEYFAALALSELSYEDIINFIEIKGTKKTHPSLFNTITFLINILESEKCNLLIQWFVENEPELLFKADKNRIESYRVKVFQDFFKKECIDKTLWINNVKAFTVKEIADFGNCEENLNFLLKIIINKDNHFRVIISAINLISYFFIPTTRIDEIKKTFFELLSNPSIKKPIKADLIEFINAQSFCVKDETYLSKIFNLFKSESNKELNRALLSLLENHHDIDNYFWYIKSEFLRDNKIVQREEKDDVSRGNNWVIQKLVVKLTNSKNFIDIVKYYFDEERNLYRDQDFSEKIIDRCIFFESLEESFIQNLLKSLRTKMYFRHDDRLFRGLFAKCNTKSQSEAFEFFLKNYTFDKVGYFLALLINEVTLPIAIRKFLDETIENTNLDYFRNFIYNNGKRDLAKSFQIKMEELGFVFKFPFLEEEDYNKMQTDIANKPQENFNCLFNKEKLIIDIKSVFKDNGDSINPNKMHEIDRIWYDENGHSNQIDTAINIVSKFVFSTKKNTCFEDISSFIDDDFLITQIKSKLDHNRDDKLIISQEQKNKIHSWCINASEQIRFDNIMEYVSLDRFTILKDYDKLKKILFFVDRFDFDMPQEFLLNSIEFFDVSYSNIEQKVFDKLLQKINNKELFDARIIYNLKNKKLFSFSLDKHIEYALDNNLHETFSTIKKYILSHNYQTNLETILNKFINLGEGFDLLIKCCDDYLSFKCWSAIKILMEHNKEKELCKEKAINYLNEEIDKNSNYHTGDALSVLFQLNLKEAIDYFISLLEEDDYKYLYNNSFLNYNVLLDYNDIKLIFEKIYLGDPEHRSYSLGNGFLNTYVSNLSIKEETFKEIQSILIKIKEDLKDVDYDSVIFYINILLDKSNDVYVNSKSKALSFDEAIIKVEEILN
ncbi:hypothetical protein [Flavobacterium sp.]|uniref:NACHT domain-containing protein n=1 Tax=Flavobacterium sp. TaxID=239 RepID=UPI002621510A|nr:hypothetical protein [Flavobacterium sp.]